MQDQDELPLTGGDVTEGLVRVGDGSGASPARRDGATIGPSRRPTVSA
ncbi:hypothetical protein [Kribbella turkmenica]|nr:hypothetical protein [Kribbella turkmenica]